MGLPLGAENEKMIKMWADEVVGGVRYHLEGLSQGKIRVFSWQQTASEQGLGERHVTPDPSPLTLHLPLLSAPSWGPREGRLTSGGRGL